MTLRVIRETAPMGQQEGRAEPETSQPCQALKAIPDDHVSHTKRPQICTDCDQPNVIYE